MTNYRLYTSSNLKIFPEKYPKIFISDNPLAQPVYIIVQNAGLGIWLKRFLTKKLGGIMGPRILMPEQAIRQFIMGFHTVKNIPNAAFVFLDGMKLALCKALEECLESDDDETMEPILSYLNQDREGRLWPLANSLAGIFNHYAMNCPALIDAWDSGRSCSQIGRTDKAAELWQMRLWNRIFNDGAPYLHLSQALARISLEDDVYDGEVARIILFGSTFLGERGLNFFQRIANSLEVHHFILSPGPSIKNPTSRYLINNAKLAIGFSNIDLQSCEKIDIWHNPGTPGCLLYRLRSSLIEDKPFDSESKEITDDGSLHFHNITDLRRCVEVLKDRILMALASDETLAPTEIGVLAPDISLYAPYIEAIFPSLNDSDDSRLPDHLPFNVTDLPEQNETPFLAAFAGLLDLPGSRFGRQGLLQLFENPCFAPMVRDTNLINDWWSFVDFLNIRWGVNAEHRKNAGAFDINTGSWEEGFERILAGYYHDEGDDPQILPYPNISEALADSAGKLMRVITELNESIRPLDGRSMDINQWVLLWERLVDYWLKPQNDIDESDRHRIKNSFRDLIALAEDMDGLSDFANTQLSWSVFRNLLDEHLVQTSRQRGRYLSNGVTCGSLKPTRAIPFRRIYVLGLDEGIWPGHERLTGFDLREKARHAIDLSRESVDRFALLEVIYSATEHLSLFYTGRSPEHGEPLSPASPVLDIIEHMGGENALEPIILRQPMLPWETIALTGNGPLATTSPQVLQISEELDNPTNTPLTSLSFNLRTHAALTEEPQMLMNRQSTLRIENPLPPCLEANLFAKRSTLPASISDLQTKINEKETIDWQELIRFLTNPIKYFYNRIMGTRIPDEEPDNSEHDILEIPYLDWYKRKSEAIQDNISTLQNPMNFIDEFRNRKMVEDAVCRTHIADFQAMKWIDDINSLSNQLIRITGEGFSPSEPFLLRFEAGLNHADIQEKPFIFDSVDQEERTWLLPAPKSTLADDSAIEVIGTIIGLRPLLREGNPDPETWTLVEFISPKMPNVSHNLRSWAVALLIGVSHLSVREVRVFRIGARDFKARRYFFREEDYIAAGSGERILLLEPNHIFKNLLNVWHNGSRNPLPLYPELADEIHKEMKKNADIDFYSLAQKKWNDIINDVFMPHSPMRDCLWRKYFLPKPNLKSSAFHAAFFDIYQPGGLF